MLEANPLTIDSIADIGCGAGEVLKCLSARLGPRVSHFYGYDVSPQAIELCQASASEHVSFHLADMLEQDVFFDAVLAIDVVEHVPDYLSFLTRLRTKGEYKIFHVPLDISVYSVFHRSRGML